MELSHDGFARTKSLCHRIRNLYRMRRSFTVPGQYVFGQLNQRPIILGICSLHDLLINGDPLST